MRERSGLYTPLQLTLRAWAAGLSYRSMMVGTEHLRGKADKVIRTLFKLRPVLKGVFPDLVSVRITWRLPDDRWEHWLKAFALFDMVLTRRQTYAPEKATQFEISAWLIGRLLPAPER